MKTETELNRLEETLLPLEVHASHIRNGIIENDWNYEEWSKYRKLKNTYTHYRRYKNMNEERNRKQNRLISYQSIRKHSDGMVM